MAIVVAFVAHSLNCFERFSLAILVLKDVWGWRALAL
jgi:hypothetical protein